MSQVTFSRDSSLSRGWQGEAVRAVTLPALEQKSFPLALLNDYDIVFSSPGVSWDEIDLFLLGEDHFNDECNKVNGAFIRAVGGDRPIVCIEGIPSMSVPENSELEDIQEELALPQTTKFLGWDACEEIQEDLKVMCYLDEEGQAYLEEEIKEALEQIANNSQLDDETECVVRQYSQELSSLKQIKQRVENLLARGITTGALLIRSTFPIRTQSFVNTLQQWREKASKVFFVSGSVHLRPVLHLQSKEFDLTPLHQEIDHHKAAILIPKICTIEAYVEKIVEGLLKSLPDGLVLTEEQMTELRIKLSLTSPEDIETVVGEFLTPIPLICKEEEDVEEIVEEILKELPDGLVLTEEQMAELRIKLSLTSPEDLETVLQEFLTPIFVAHSSLTKLH